MTIKKSKIPIIITILVLVVCAFVATVILATSSQERKNIYTFDFSVGGLSSSGDFVQSDDSIVSNYLLCEDLKIERKVDTQTRIRVYYYDIDKKFLGATDKLFDHYYRDEDYPLAGYCRVVLYPDMGEETAEDFSLTIFNKLVVTRPDSSFSGLVF